MGRLSFAVIVEEVIMQQDAMKHSWDRLFLLLSSLPIYKSKTMNTIILNYKNNTCFYTWYMIQK
jgi:hypothetical protein